MDFKLTEEQELIRQNMREFCKKYVDPIAVEIDENSRHPAELFQKLAEGDWMGMPIPQEYGGAGADQLTFVIAVEELSRSCASTGFTVSTHAGIVCMMLLLFGTEEQKKKFLIPLAKGQAPGGLRPDRTRSGHGRDGRCRYRRNRRQRLRHQWNQDLHLQRPNRRHVSRLCLDGQSSRPERHERLHRPQGSPRYESRENISRRWGSGHLRHPR